MVSVIWSRLEQRLLSMLRPRLTWQYSLSLGIATYVGYCFWFASPLLSSTLPAYSGPYSVGTIYLETPCEPRVINDARFRDTDHPAFQVRGRITETNTSPADLASAPAGNSLVHTLLPLDKRGCLLQASPPVDTTAARTRRGRVCSVRPHQQLGHQRNLHLQHVGVGREHKDPCTRRRSAPPLAG